MKFQNLFAIAALVIGSMLMAGCPASDDANTTTTGTTATTNTEGSPQRMDEDRTENNAGGLVGTEIKTALLADTTVGAMDIEVDTNTANTVVLRGTVETEQQKQRAEEIARERVEANVTIQNDLVVDPSGARDAGTAPGTTRQGEGN